MARFHNKPASFYPRMGPRDAAIWTVFLQEHGHEYEGFDYDLCVGEGCKAPELLDDQDRHMWNSVKKKRIDAVGYQGDQIHLFEVKPIANAAGIGQIQMYAHLFVTTFDPTKPVKKIIVAGEIDDDIKGLAQFLGIDLIHVNAQIPKEVIYETEQE